MSIHPLLVQQCLWPPLNNTDPVCDSWEKTPGQGPVPSLVRWFLCGVLRMLEKQTRLRAPAPAACQLWNRDLYEGATWAHLAGLDEVSPAGDKSQAAPLLAATLLVRTPCRRSTVCTPTTGPKGSLLLPCDLLPQSSLTIPDDGPPSCWFLT